MGNLKQKWTTEEEALLARISKYGLGKWKFIQRDLEYASGSPSTDWPIEQIQQFLIGLRWITMVLMITFFFAEIFLLAGSAKNVQRTKYVNDQQVSCESLKKGIFGAAAAFIVFTGVLIEL